MSKTKIPVSVGIDIGGSHITVCLINLDDYSIVDNGIQECFIDSQQPASYIFNKWTELIEKVLLDVSKEQIESAGIAMPGPFDYEKGISKMFTVAKYKALFGINIKQYFSSVLDIQADKIHFVNDAAAFALGEYHQDYSQDYKKILALTLGTGFGSTYIYNGEPQTELLYNVPYKDSIADDYFSTRWFQKVYNKRNTGKITNVKQLSELAESGDASALDLFEEFGSHLGEFLRDYLTAPKADCCIIGGNISKAWQYFAPALKRSLNKHVEIKLIKANCNAQSALLGAALYAQSQKDKELERRKTSQYLIPEKIQISPKGKYDIYPGHKLKYGSIKEGYRELADYIVKQKTIVIDGYAGVFWEDLCKNLGELFKEKGIKVYWHNVSAAIKDSNDVEQMIAPYLGGDDPIFGRRTTLRLKDFFDQEQLSDIQPEEAADINILYGTGAALCQWEAPLIYVDLPKNELQFRMRAGAICNLGAEKAFDAKAMYKRFYFIDWIVLNQHKQELVSKIDVVVDDQRPENPYWTDGESLRASLKEMSESFFRVRPWFEPGPWGGTWMKENINQLSEDVPNYAWSFELIVPENGLMLKDNGKMLEVSFDFLMFQEHKNVLGEAANHFAYEFPIRFDYLDTFDGGNLSVQVHPQQDYFVKEFGETFTQDECYYMLDVKNDAEVYLGFQDDIQAEEFRSDLEDSFHHSTEVDIKKHVKTVKANKHDLFLIPGGTIHGSGKDNLVLEISSTPYIFTFKLYDWLRLDLEGKPRPLNIDRGFKNLDFERKGDVVEKEHISKPTVIEQGEDWELYHLPTHKAHFYDVHRYEFDTEVEVQTQDQCHIMMLVEGSSIILETEKGAKQRFNFAETFVVPAACKSYRLINESGSRCKVVKAFVKSEKVRP